MSKSQGTKSPLTSSPLRNPGQSLDEEINKLVDETASVWIVAIVMMITLAGFEWWRSYAALPYTPISFSIVALLVTVIGIWKLRKFRKKLKRLRLGRDGEKAVGQYLEHLREQGYKVFHDLIGDGFNIDHLLIGKKGVFTIETKTYSKPVGKKATIKFDGINLTVNNFKPDRNPIVQAKSQAQWLSDLLIETTGRSLKIKPVLVFPGWYVEATNMRDVWILNPKGLASFLANETDNLSKEDVSLISFHISRFIRAPLK